MGKEENFIHLKFEHEEAVQSRRDMLTSEIDIINVMKSLENFMSLRMLELKAKAKLFREIKKLETEIKKLERNLPDVKVPRILKANVIKKKESREKSFEVKTPKSNDLESQLAEIQRKLKQLSG